MTISIRKAVCVFMSVVFGLSSFSQGSCKDIYGPKFQYIEDRMQRARDDGNSKLIKQLDDEYTKTKAESDNCIAHEVKMIEKDTITKAIKKPSEIDTINPKGESKSAYTSSKDTLVKSNHTITHIPKGINYNQTIDTIDYGTMEYKVQIGGKVFDYIVVDLNKSDIRLHLLEHTGKNKDHNYGSLGELLNSDDIGKDKDKIQMLTNGGMYLYNSQPQGLFIENHQLITPLDTTNPRNGDNFHLMPNGIFFIKNGEAYILSTDSFKRSKFVDTSISYATQSGPLLVKDGERHPAFTEGSSNEKLRSGVCVINSKKVVFAICEQINFWDFANFFKDYIKGKNALFLDGVVSQMYFRYPGKNKKLRRQSGGNFGPMISVTAK